MPPVARKSRSKRFAEYEEKPVKEFDIENEVPDDDESGSDDGSEDDLAGTEHYVTVGKSKLRQKELPILGPQYRGARVSRAALEHSDDEEDEDEEEEDDDEEEEGSDEESDEYDDPELADLEADQMEDGEEDFEIDSDNALCESDEEQFKDFTFRASSKPRDKAQKQEKVNGNANGRIKPRPTAVDFMSSSGAEEEDEEGSESEDGSEADFDGARLSGEDDDDEEEEEEEEDDDDDEEDEDGSEDEEDDDEEDEEDEEEDEPSDSKNDVRSNLKKALSQGKQTIVSAMSQAAQNDAKKGMAVRVQRRAFDNILHMRVRLQKALVAANTFNMVENEGTVATKPYQAAEEAAVKLWNTIDSVRQNFLPAKVGEKRKHTEIDLDTPSQEIWESMQAGEEAALSHRRSILNKWSDRVKKNTTAGTTKTRNLVQNDVQSLVSVLDSQLVSSERLVKRARTPRSCAPAQAAKKVEEDPEIYDDADFYQLLLKELVDQRSADTGAPGESVTTVRWAALKEAKVRKQVDRRASKGRKLRYTVHEKLQNFMAPEDRRQWEEPAIDRLFGTLFGQKLMLTEEDEQASDEDDEMGGVNVEEEGLKLFRN